MTSADLEPRQIWATPTSIEPRCTGYQLPSNGVLILNATQTISLAQDAIYSPECTPSSTASPLSNATLPVWGIGDPFEASTVPQIFVLGATLVISWSLVIILLITPRTSFVLGNTGGDHLGRRAQGNGGSSLTVIAVGGRPWLQKFAATTVGISLFIACVNSFKIIEDQYQSGYEDAQLVTEGVVGSLELRVIRVISTTSLWLAQVQTLIRLFPRHREKVIIKWAGFGLIFLDTIFAILNNFVAGNGAGPGVGVRKYTEAIPALSYLFELALSLLYAAWVIYYSLVKRRFAFFHPKMRNICVVALLSYASILIPVAFFVLDISKPNLATWGDYVRWVGAAAASVVVWEWVERIEALEREERKDGILGREIFDGDEMLGTSPSGEIHWPRSRSIYKGQMQTSWDFSRSRPFRRTKPDQYEKTVSTATGLETGRPPSSARSPVHFGQRRVDLAEPPLPPTTVSPVSRSDTTSAGSTVYTVVHHPVSASNSPVQDTRHEPITSGIQFAPAADIGGSRADRATTFTGRSATAIQAVSSRLNSVSNPFKRRRHSPPAEISRSAVDAAGQPSIARLNKGRSPTHFLRMRRHQPVSPSELPIIVVPAQPVSGRDRIWSPPNSQEASDAARHGTAQSLQTLTSETSHPSRSPSRSSPSQPRQANETALPPIDDQIPVSRNSEITTPHQSIISAINHRSPDTGISHSMTLASVQETVEDAVP